MMNELDWEDGHNPYFTGNHFAIEEEYMMNELYEEVTILILLETTLQSIV